MKSQQPQEQSRKMIIGCRFSYKWNWETVRSIMWTTFGKSHVCLRYQVRNRLWQLVAWHLLSFVIRFHALFRYAIRIYVPKLTGDKIKHYRFLRNTKTQHEKTKYNTS